MLRCHLVGFSPEGEVRVGEFLGRRGALALPARPQALGAALEGGIVLLNGQARTVVLSLIEALGDPSPGCPVIAVMPTGQFPVWDAGLFPRWVRCVACQSLGRYLAETFGLPDRVRPRAPPSFAWQVGRGPPRITRPVLLGTAGAVLRVAEAPGRGTRVTCYARGSGGRAVVLRGVVAGARREAGAARCTISFAPEAPRRLRELVDLLAGPAPGRRNGLQGDP